jgi:hypothetical protein
MKQCLQCKKEFQSKKDTAKYCSVSCRVMWNRKNGKKKQAEKNAFDKILERLNSIEGNISVSATKYPTAIECQAKAAEYASVSKPSSPILKRSFENYRQLRIECDNEDEWIKLKSEILSCDHLSQKQKTLLTT